MELNRTPSPVLSPFIGARKIVPSERVVYDDGPVGIQDPSKGLLFQVWRARYVSDTVYLAAPNHPESAFLTMRCIHSIGLSFDQNARPILTYLKEGSLYLYWHNPTVQQYTHTLINTNVTGHGVYLDVRTPVGIFKSQVIVAYTKNDNLYYATQDERYATSRLFASGVNGYLIQMGMSKGNRMQFLVQAHHPGVYSETKPWGETYG